LADPVEIMEVQAGWKLILDEAQSALSDLSTSREFPHVLAAKVAEGELGAVTGQGFYAWPEEKLTAWKRMMPEALVERFLGRVCGG
jgi:3-hydroxyacyl-CoA dehydrogenase